MKKTLLLIAVALFVSSTAFSQFKFGAGATVGTKSKINENMTSLDDLFTTGFGLNARGVYDLTEDFALSFGVSYFLPKKFTEGTNETKFTIYGANVDAFYYLMKGDASKLYALGGLNYAKFQTKYNGTEVPEFSDDGFSWEVGGGIEFGNFFAEVKYDGNMEQIVGTAGIYF